LEYLQFNSQRQNFIEMRGTYQRRYCTESMSRLSLLRRRRDQSKIFGWAILSFIWPNKIAQRGGRVKGQGRNLLILYPAPEALPPYPLPMPKALFLSPCAIFKQLLVYHLAINTLLFLMLVPTLP
jgi:hypothetical protein